MNRSRANASRMGRSSISARSTAMIESPDGSSIAIRIMKSRIYINLEVAKCVIGEEFRLNRNERVEFMRQS